MKKEGIVLFDGYCNLCSASVRFIMRHGRDGYFRFISLGSDEALRLLEGRPHGQPLPDSLILVSGERIWFRSRAVLQIARKLRFPWNLAVVLYIIPRFLRDPLYDWLAGKRYRWFGKRDSCYLP